MLLSAQLNDSEIDGLLEKKSLDNKSKMSIDPENAFLEIPLLMEEAIRIRDRTSKFHK